MITARAVYRDGAIVLSDPVDWSDGVELEVRPAETSSAAQRPGGAKPGGELLDYLDHLYLDEPGCFLSEEALDRLSLLQEVPLDSPSHWDGEAEASGG